MAGEDVVEPLLLQHAQRLLQAVEEMHRRGAVPIGLRALAEQPLPVPVDARQLGRGGGGQRLAADRGKGHAGRQHQPLLRAGDDDIDAPFVHAEIHRGERGDRVDQEQRRMLCRIDRPAQCGDRVDDAGRGLAMHQQHRLDAVLSGPRAAALRACRDRAGWRQSFAKVSTSRPNASPRMPQFSEKKPLSTTRTLSPGENRLTSAASHAPCPVAA